MTAQRMLLLSSSLFTFLGIFLTGYNIVHWLLYIPPTMFLIAGITGFCPGLIIFKKMGFKDQ